MKTLTFLLLLIPAIAFAQQAKIKVNFNKPDVKLKIEGLIEIDGHTFKNDTCKCPIIFNANLEGIEITDCENTKFFNRKCAKENCKIIHLEKKLELIYYKGPTLKAAPYIFTPHNEK